VNNKVFKCGGAGISSIQADYVTIEKNKVFNNSWYTVYSTSGISTWQNWRFDNSQGYKTIIRNNKVYNNRNYIPWLAMGKIVDGNGIIIDDSKNTQNGSSLGAYTGRTLVANNIVFNNGGSGIHAYESEHVDIINNTAYMNSQSPELNDGEIFANTSADVNIVNNILFTQPGKRVNSNYNNNNVYYDYNIYFNSQDIAVKGAHDLIVDPKFVSSVTNPAQLDLRLQPNSPAINNGLVWKVVTSDYASNPRPSTNRYDIGAYEYQF
jgi:parallel beta-helix repeat protein